MQQNTKFLMDNNLHDVFLDKKNFSKFMIMKYSR